MAEYFAGETRAVKPGEPIEFTNKCESPFRVGMGIMFGADGEYLVIVGRNKVSVQERYTADVRPVVWGEWIEENSRPRSSQFYCSVCHRTAYDPQPTRSVSWVKRCRYAFCPNCGAKMREEQDDV